MGGFVHLANYACFAGIVFHSDLAGKLTCPQTEVACSTSSLVYQEAANLFGCPENCEANFILSSPFSNIAVL